MTNVSNQQDAYLYKILRSIKYNGVFIIISVLFPLLFIKMDAGRELFIQLTDKDQWYNNSLIVAAFHFLSLSMWCFPAFAVSLFIFFTHSNKGNRQFYADELAKTYLNDKDGKSISRFWASIPFILLNITLVTIQFGKWWGIGLLAVLIVYATLDKVYKLSYRLKGITGNPLNRFMVKYEWAVYLILLLFYVLIPFLLKGLPAPVLKWSLAGFYLLSMILVFWHQFLLDTTLTTPHAAADDPKVKAKEFRTDRRRHCLLMVLLIIIIIILYILMCYSLLPLISPIFVSICISSILIIGFELFISTQLVLTRIANDNENKLRYKVYEVVVIIFCIGMIYSYFAHSINKGNIRTEQVLESGKIPGDYKQYALDTFFTKWYEDRQGDSNIYKPGDSNHVVYLISGQGGGSRAGAWFLMAMKYLEQIDPDIYQKTFSISAVSGSITGANMYIASKQFNLLNNEGFLLKNDPNDPKQRDSVEQVLNKDPILTFVKDIYSKNYLSSGIFGLTLSDYFIDGIRCNLGNSNRDRNFHFQNEEINSFLQSAALKNRYQNKDSIDLAKQYFLNDYLYNYRDTQKTDIPIFLINTTIIETGRKAIFSPIRLSTFSMFEDVYDNFRECGINRFKALPLITCVNQGQAFPLLNTYNHIHGTGRLGDGGLYENSGTETTQELYEKLLQLVKSDTIKLGKIKLVCITILNNPIRNEELTSSSNSYLGTLQFAIANPFKGRERTAIERLNNFLNPKINGNHPILQPKNSYSLTRALSKQTINEMYLDLINSRDFISAFKNTLRRAANIETSGGGNGLTTSQNEIHSVDSAAVNIPTKKTSPDNKNGQIAAYVFVQTTSALKEHVANINTLLKDNVLKVYQEEIINQDYNNLVRYFNQEDAANAYRICEQLNNESDLNTRFTVQDLSQSFPNIPKGQIEVWVGKP